MIGKALAVATALTLAVPAIAVLTAMSVGANVAQCITAPTSDPTGPATLVEATSPTSAPTGPPGGAASPDRRAGAPARPGCLPALGTNASVVDMPAGTPPDVAAAVRTGLSLVGTPSGWYQLCDKLACYAYGYANSGYPTAAAHWQAMLATGHAHPGDPCPPLGSFVFFDTGRPDGHVSLVVQADPGACDPNTIQVTANEIFDRATGHHGGVYQLSLARLTSMYQGGHGYLGWSPPICAGTLRGAAPTPAPARAVTTSAGG